MKKLQRSLADELNGDVHRRAKVVRNDVGLHANAGTTALLA